ncbi:MAG: hypothetical protein ACYTHK_02515 [Planctomycetota bacterium]
MSDRAHNRLLDLIAAFFLLGGLYVVVEALFLGEESGWGIFRQLLIGILIIAVARGFKKRKGWAFLTLSVGLLVGWLVELTRAIVEFTDGGWEAAKLPTFSLLLCTVLIGYLGRWSMERRFRPHLDVD